MVVLHPEKTKFRIRIYDIDSVTMGPTHDLCDSIIVKTGSKFITVNLEKYKIRIPQKDFSVAIEWLKIPHNESKHKIKHADGKVTETITYRPSIGWTDNQHSTMEAWMLDYKGTWRPMFNMHNKTGVSISAKVKY